MERWQAKRVRNARESLDEFIAKAREDVRALERQIAEAERIRGQLTTLADFA